MGKRIGDDARHQPDFQPPAEHLIDNGDLFHQARRMMQWHQETHGHYGKSVCIDGSYFLVDDFWLSINPHEMRNTRTVYVGIHQTNLGASCF